MTDIGANLSAIKAELGNYPQNPILLAVSKKQERASIEIAYRHGQRHFGENYLQEGLGKIEALSNLKEIQWHFIGPIQSNKCKDIAEHFQWVQSLDRLKVAKLLNQYCPQGKVLNVCVQVNIDNEEQKSGIPFKEIESFCEQVQALPHLRLRGLMCIPKVQKSISEQRNSFAKLANKLSELGRANPEIDTLSMGMSDDYRLALEQGSTMIRLGTAIFGPREKN